jgi:2-phospho-L-lactate/phosphoenolpyruvate guanylyltransferase
VQQWSVVVPAKALRLAKTRLGPTGTRAAHEELVLAMLGDVLDAVLGCPVVGSAWVVTDDPRAAAVAASSGARPVPGAPAGLDAALRHGAAVAANPLVATLHSDLPALRPAELAAALDAAAAHRRSFVADADGTGTTLLAVTDGVLEPAFGPGSAAAHAASGAVPLEGAWPGLRRDVDTPAHLAEAALLGTGPRTRAALRAACA